MKKILLLLILTLTGCDYDDAYVQPDWLIINDCVPTGQYFNKEETRIHGRVATTANVKYYVYDCSKANLGKRFSTELIQTK